MCFAWGFDGRAPAAAAERGENVRSVLRSGPASQARHSLSGRRTASRARGSPNASARPARGRARAEGRNDARTGMPARMLAGAMCVQRFDDSLSSAIRITYRISLRSSSMPEPRDPLLKVLIRFLCFSALRRSVCPRGAVGEVQRARGPRRAGRGCPPRPPPEATRTVW